MSLVQSPTFGGHLIFPSSFLLLNITRWAIDFRNQGLDGLKQKNRGRPSSINIRFQIFIYTNSAGKIKTDK